MELKYRPKTVIGWIALSLVGIVVGNSLWEYVFSPLLPWIGRAILTGASLGIESVRDGVYADAAIGHHEQYSLSLLSIVIVLTLYLPLFLVRRAYLQKQPKAEQVEIAVATDPPSKKITPRRLGYWLIALYVPIVILQVQYLMANYTNKAITYFQQSYEAVAAYVPEAERLRLRSDFAQVRTKGEFDSLAARMDAIAREHELRLPDKDSLW